jgi:hypothetical protein
MDMYRISRQGNLGMNPVGGWFFIISTGIVGLFLISYFSFAYRRLGKNPGILNKIFRLFGSLGGFGLFLVGVNPEGSGGIIDTLHNIGNTMAFGGLGVAAFLSIVILMLKMLHKEPWPTFTQMGIIFLSVFHFALMFLFISNGEVMQWTGFYTMLIWNLIFYAILPESPLESN